MTGYSGLGGVDRTEKRKGGLLEGGLEGGSFFLMQDVVALDAVLLGVGNP